MNDISRCHKCTWPDCTTAGEQQPVARVVPFGATVKLEWASVAAAHNCKPGPLYAAPPAQPAQRLTDERIDEICRQGDYYSGTPSWPHFDVNAFARAIEAAIVPPGYVVVPVESKEKIS